ncbi:MAG TPA: DUF3592 domain-containing protein [Phycisphaerae bacterium]|nr:DUF3592 domain-containing protein [Phycisphaerae bacterium]
MWMRFWGVVLLLGGLALALVAVNSIAEQDRAIRTFIPTPATVDSTGIDVYHGRRSDSYSPRIRYEFIRDGKTHFGTGIFPVDASGSSDWASSIIAQFPENRPITAYVDPLDPDNAILIREYGSSPYWGALVTCAAAFVGAMMLLGYTRAAPRTMRALSLGASGFHLLLPPKNLRRQKWEAAAWTAGFLLPALLIDTHYAARGWPYSAGGWFLLLVTATGAAALLFWAIHRWLTTRVISDARLQISPLPLVRGEPLTLQVEWDALKDLHVQNVDARLVCLKCYREKRGSKTYTGTSVLGEQSLPMHGHHDTAHGAILQAAADAAVSAQYPPTSDPPAKRAAAYLYHVWEIRLHVQLADAADYRERFIVQIV